MGACAKMLITSDTSNHRVSKFHIEALPLIVAEWQTEKFRYEITATEID